MGIGLLFRCNRLKPGRNLFVPVLFGTAALCDVLLFLILFPEGKYRNYGIGSAYGVAVYPIALAAATALATAWNKENMEDENGTF